MDADHIAAAPAAIGTSVGEDDSTTVADVGAAAVVTTTTTIDDDALGLHVDHHHSWLGLADSGHWWDECVEHVHWYRVKYKSARFKNQCETPCWTSFYGGLPHFVPFEPVPDWLQPLVAQVSRQCGGVPFNALLMRLYFDGGDEIAYHTDGRTFLGDTPTIASLSLGATAQFQMRRMTNVWPCGGDDGVDHSTPERDFSVSNGDLLVMRGVTQKHWHHRVPKARSRRPRININFRYIIPDSPDAERGQQTYYKYMVHGDSAMPSSDLGAGGVRNGIGADRWRNDHTGPMAPSYSYDDLLRRRGSLLSFVRRESSTAATEVYNEAAASTHQQRQQAKLQLQSILGTELSDAKRVELLERCGWNVRRAVAEHFNDEAGALVAAQDQAAPAEVNIDATDSTHQKGQQAKLQLQSILGTELSDGEDLELLERCGWDVQRAVAEHFNDEAAAQAALSSRASASEVEPMESSMKRPAQGANRKQHKKVKQREQRSVLSMWKPK